MCELHYELKGICMLKYFAVFLFLTEVFLINTIYTTSKGHVPNFSFTNCEIIFRKSQIGFSFSNINGSTYNYTIFKDIFEIYDR